MWNRLRSLEAPITQNGMSENASFKVTLLGTGTSSGVPTISCKCPTCQSNDSRDKRLRCSVMLENASSRIVIDTSPDFRQQMLLHKVTGLDAVLYTHHHFDHIGGFDDLRAFNYTSGKPIPIYLNEKTYKELRRTFLYAFEEPEQIGGGVPQIEINFIKREAFRAGDFTIIPIPIMHGKLEVMGFRVGDFAYCTDTNHIPEESYKLLEGLDALVIDSLRYHSHSTHYCLKEALAAIERIAPKHAFLTHIAHQIKHSEIAKLLPDNVKPAYDSLTLRF